MQNTLIKDAINYYDYNSEIHKKLISKIAKIHLNDLPD